MIQVEGGQNKVDSPLSVLEHGILESELGKKKKKKKRKEICSEILSLSPSEKAHFLRVIILSCVCDARTLVSVMSMKMITQWIVSGEARGWNQTPESCPHSLSEYQARVLSWQQGGNGI